MGAAGALALSMLGDGRQGKHHVYRVSQTPHWSQHTTRLDRRAFCLSAYIYEFEVVSNVDC